MPGLVTRFVKSVGWAADADVAAAAAGCRQEGVCCCLDYRAPRLFTVVEELSEKNFTTKLPRTTLGTGLARTGTNTGTPRKEFYNKTRVSEKNLCSELFLKSAVSGALTSEKPIGSLLIANPVSRVLLRLRGMYAYKEPQTLKKSSSGNVRKSHIH